MDYIQRFYKREFKINKLDFSDKIYLENIFNDYKQRKEKNQKIYFKAFENNFSL